MNDAVLGSVAVATGRESWQLTYAGGTVATQANSGRTLGQQSPGALVGVGGRVVLKDEADRSAVQRILRMAGVIPLVLPDGARYAVQTPEQGQPFTGWVDNETIQLDATWRVRRDCVLADVLYRGALGSGAFVTTNYVAVGTNILAVDSGRQLHGLGSWNQSYIVEGTIADTAANARPQPMLVAEFVPSDTAEFAIGWTTAPGGARPFGGHGIGVSWNGGVLTAIGYNDVFDVDGYSLIGINNPTITVVVVARPVAARVEIWWNNTRVYSNNAVPWTMPTTPLRAMASIRSGVCTLRRWWATRG